MTASQQVLLPIATLVLGYALNLVGSAIDSNRGERRRRVADKERAYATIFAKLHELFERYRRITLNANLDRLGVFEPSLRPEDIKVLAALYDELETIVFEQSLYLSAATLQRLLDLKITDLRDRANDHSLDTAGQIEFQEQHVDRLWSRAKAIMSDMRTEIGLEPYPDAVMKLWR